MTKIVNIFEAFILIAGAIWMFLYHSGRLNYSADKEERRRKKIEKYGGLLIACCLFCLFGATLIILGTILDIL